jgi:UDP-N-acetylmuramyl pentapeptide synthase
MLHNLRPTATRTAAAGCLHLRRMAELGPQTEALHAELGQAVAEAGVDLLADGPGALPRTTAQTARQTARRDLQTRSFDDTLPRATICRNSFNKTI